MDCNEANAISSDAAIAKRLWPSKNGYQFREYAASKQRLGTPLFSFLLNANNRRHVNAFA